MRLHQMFDVLLANLTNAIAIPAISLARDCWIARNSSSIGGLSNMRVAMRSASGV
jgi:hypothetical protein